MASPHGISMDCPRILNNLRPRRMRVAPSRACMPKDMQGTKIFIFKIPIIPISVIRQRGFRAIGANEPAWLMPDGKKPIGAHMRMPDENERRKWQDPERILGEAGLKEGDVFIDIGCGKGFFAVPAARIVGRNGKVYAIDASGERLDELRKRAEDEGLRNIVITPGRAEELVPCRDCGDIAFFGVSLHDFDDAARVLSNVHAMLKKGGKVVDLDWKKEHGERGPPYEIRFDERHATELLSSAGFKVIQKREEGREHYIIYAEKV